MLKKSAHDPVIVSVEVLDFRVKQTYASLVSIRVMDWQIILKYDIYGLSGIGTFSREWFLIHFYQSVM